MWESINPAFALSTRLRELEGGILGGLVVGLVPVAAVEIDVWCRGVLFNRQRDGMLPEFPIWDDVRTFDGAPWRGRIDVVAGGFPCQDISSAWAGPGLAGHRSGLWFEMARIIGEVQPAYAFIENVGNVRKRGLPTIREGLSRIGYHAVDGDFLASDLGAPHLRKRTFILAWRGRQTVDGDRGHGLGDVGGVPSPQDGGSGNQLRAVGGAREAAAVRETGARGVAADSVNPGLSQQSGACGVGAGCMEAACAAGGADGEDRGVAADDNRARREEQRRASPVCPEHLAAECSRWWAAEPEVGRVADGVPDRVARIRALGNAQVPGVAALAWRVLTETARKEAAQ